MSGSCAFTANSATGSGIRAFSRGSEHAYKLSMLRSTHSGIDNDNVDGVSRMTTTFLPEFVTLCHIDRNESSIVVGLGRVPSAGTMEFTYAWPYAATIT